VPQAQNFAVNTHEKYAISAGTAGTQPALCAGTTKRQFVIFPHFEFYFSSCFEFKRQIQEGK